MILNDFLKTLETDPTKIDFEDTIAVIDSLYEFTPTEFKNGDLVNAAGKNSGSCKIFSFAQMHNLSQQQTLACFGRYYRDHVLNNPGGDDHQNIRNFMKTGWSRIEFSGQPLQPR